MAQGTQKTDRELLQIWRSDNAREGIRSLTPEEQSRLVQLTRAEQAPENFQKRLQSMLDFVSDFTMGAQDLMVGASQGAIDTGADVLNMFGHLPGGQQFQTASESLRPSAEPQNRTQEIGKGIEQLAELMAPLGLASKARTATRAPGLLRMLGEGAEIGAKVGLQTQDPVSATTAALFGAAAVPVIGAAERAGRFVFTRLPERLYSNIFKLAKEDFDDAIRAQAAGLPENPTLAREVLERGLRGSNINMAVFSLRKLDDLEAQIKNMTPQMGVQGKIRLPNRKDFAGLLDEIEQKYGRRFFQETGKKAASIKDEILNTGSSGSFVKAGAVIRLKRFLDSIRNRSSFRLDPNLTTLQEELKVASDLVRNTLRKDRRFAQLMDEERIYISAVDRIIDDAVRRENKQLLTLTDAILGGGGVSSGAPGAGLGAMAAVRFMQQPTRQTRIGFGLDRIGKALPPEIAAPIGRAAAGSLGKANEEPQ